MAKESRRTGESKEKNEKPGSIAIQN